jgi:hypothetical protein
VVAVGDWDAGMVWAADGVRLSSAHLRVLAVGVRHQEGSYPESEQVLLEAAAGLSVDDFALAVRRWRSMADDATGNDDAHERFRRRHPLAA